MPLTAIPRPGPCFWAGKNYSLFIRKIPATTAIAAIIPKNETGDFGVVGGGDELVVPGSDTAVPVVAGTDVFTVVGSFSNMLNVVDPDTSITVPDILTRYSSGLNVDASTSNDQRFIPPLPARTVTVPDEPENSPL